MTIDNPVLNEMQLTITRNALRYHVGHVITCPSCQSIMDCRRAVEIDFHHANGELVHSAIRCATCFDAAGERFRTAAAARGLTVEVVDGRTLWQAAGPVAPRVRKAKLLRESA